MASLVLTLSIEPSTSASGCVQCQMVEFDALMKHLISENKIIALSSHLQSDLAKFFEALLAFQASRINDMFVYRTLNSLEHFSVVFEVTVF